MPRSKESTARINMFHLLKIPFVFTLEASFAGASKGSLSGKHFSLGDLENIGKYVLRAIHQAKKIENNKVLLKEISAEVDSMPIVDKDSDSDGEDEDSDSASEGEPEIVNNNELLKTLKEIEMGDSDIEGLENEIQTLRNKKQRYIWN